MDRIKVILVDDEKTSLKSLEIELKRDCPNVQIIGKYTDPELAIAKISGDKPDIVFLDIEMPKISGFDLLQRIPIIDFQIIFITAYDEFAIKAFEVNAVAYLLKPVLRLKLINAVEKAIERRKNYYSKAFFDELVKSVKVASSNSIAIPTSYGFELVQPEIITHLRAENNYTWLYTSENREFLISKSLKQVFVMLPQEKFFRSHKSYCVNLKFVRKYVRGRGGYLVLNNDTHIPVSRSQKIELFRLLGQG